MGLLDSYNSYPDPSTQTPQQIASLLKAMADSATIVPTNSSAADAPAPTSQALSPNDPSQVTINLPSAPPATATPAQPNVASQAPDPNQVAAVNTDSSFPTSDFSGGDPNQNAAPSQTGGDPSQSGSGGLLSSLLGPAQAAASDPNQAKGLLSQLGSMAQNVGQKLTNLSPNASQALIAGGLTMLANNNGKQNLGQIIGDGGIAGINDYQTNVQNQNANAIAQQKLRQDLAEKAAANNIAQQQADTDRYKALNAPTTVAPGNSVTTPAMMGQGIAPQGSGQPVVARTVDVTDGNGNTMTQQLDTFGNPIGAPMPKTLAYTGPLTPPQQATVNTAATTAANSQAGLQKTQNMLAQLQPTIPDPNNPGQTIPNPSYIGVVGGIPSSAATILQSITGGQTQSQLMRQQIEQNVRLSMLQGYKGGIGGRLTNTDVQMLQQGMPPDNANGTTLANYLQAYSHLQQDQASRDAATAAYYQANRGDASPLRTPLTINGTTFPAQTTLSQVLAKAPALGQQAANQAQSGTQGNSSSAAPAQQAQSVISAAQQAARNGDPNAQAALKQRGLSW